MVKTALVKAVSQPLEWSIEQLLDGFYKQMTSWVSYIVLIAGIVLLGIAVFQLVKKFSSGGQGGGMSWVLIIIMGLVGGVLVAGGLNFVFKLTSGAKDSIDEMGNTGQKSQDKKGGGSSDLKTILFSDGTVVTLPDTGD